MIKSDDEHVLFIEPKRGASKEPVQDELTADMREALEQADLQSGIVSAR